MSPAQVFNIGDPRDAFPKDIIRQGFELGFHSLLIPETYGGIGGTILDSAILLEELAAGDIGIATAFHVVMSMSEMIAKNGTPEQYERWLRPIAEDTSGDYLVSFGASEPAGGTEIFCRLPDPKLGTRTTAKRAGNDYLINGQKIYSTNASAAQLYGELIFEDMRLSKDNLLGEEGGGFDTIKRHLRCEWRRLGCHVRRYCKGRL